MRIQHFPLLSRLVHSLLNYCCQLPVATTGNCKNKSFQTNFFLFFPRFHSLLVDNGRRHLGRFAWAVPVIRYPTISKNLPFHSCRYRTCLKLQCQLPMLLLEQYYYYYSDYCRFRHRRTHYWPPIRLSKTKSRIGEKWKLIFD